VNTVFIIAGLDQELHDRVRRESGDYFAPSGRLVLKPLNLKTGYGKDYGNKIIEEIHKYIVGSKEDTKISIQMIYVREGCTKEFQDCFFPFCLSKNIDKFVYPADGSRNQKERAMNEYVSYLKRETKRVHKIAALMKDRTDIHNMTPLLLPIRNFQSKKLIDLLSGIYEMVFDADEPSKYLDSCVNKFLADHPRGKPLGSGSAQHCFTDGRLYFKSPGRHRHGFYRHSKHDAHEKQCLLNARSRLGGPFDYTFHYDCAAAKGTLPLHSPNCHGEDIENKPTHINIAPNDYII